MFVKPSIGSLFASPSRVVPFGVFAIVAIGMFVAGGEASAQFRSRMSNVDSRGATDPHGSRGAESSAGNSTYQTPATPRKLQMVLREGTFIGPVRGRFVNRGQRWHFMADPTAPSGTTGGDAGPSELIEVGVARKVVINENTLLGRSREQSQRILEVTDVSAIGQATQPSHQSERAVHSHLADSIIVVENLMLGRVADAIEDDPQDDYWTITGRVTEFQDENRLIVLTAYRAPSKTQPRP